MPWRRNSVAMCVVALALNAHPEWPLILVGNRDEFHARPATPMAHWPDDSGIIAGRDLQAGGTWMGVNPAQQRVAVVTNVRGALPDPSKASRGALVTQMLTGQGEFAAIAEMDEESAAANPAHFQQSLDRFNAFNLIVVADGSAKIFSNRPAAQVQSLKRGIIALANQPAFTPCPRAARLQAALQACCDQGAEPQSLLSTLRDTAEPALFIKAMEYGTRASTLIAQHQSGEYVMVERRYEAGGHPMGMTALSSP